VEAASARAPRAASTWRLLGGHHGFGGFEGGAVLIQRLARSGTLPHQRVRGAQGDRWPALLAWALASWARRWPGRPWPATTRPRLFLARAWATVRRDSRILLAGRPHRSESGRAFNCWGRKPAAPGAAAGRARTSCHRGRTSSWPALTRFPPRNRDLSHNGPPIRPRSVS